MRVQIDERYAVCVKDSEEPGKSPLMTLEKFGWLEIDGIRQQVPQVLAVYESPVLLVRDLISDAIGGQVFRGQMKTITGYVAETRRLAELAQIALAELQVNYV